MEGWKTVTCDLCKKRIGAPEEALVRLKLIGSGYFHFDCYAKGIAIGKDNPFASIILALLAVRSPASAVAVIKKKNEINNMAEKRNAIKLQAFMSKTANDMLMAGLLAILLAASVFLLSEGAAQQPIVPAVFLAFGLAFVCAPLDYRMRLGKHKKMLRRKI